VRRLLVAGLAALAVTLGLVATTGVASADPGDHGRDRGAPCTTSTGVAGFLHLGVCVAIGVGGSTGTGGGSRVPCVPLVAGHHLENGVCVADHNGGGNGGPWGGPGGNHGNPGGYGGGWHPGLPWGGSPTLYGHQLWLNANLGLDICGYGNSYDLFLNRNLQHRSDIDRYLGRGRWQSLYTSDCNSNIAVIPGGLTLVNGNLLNLQLLGLNGAGTVNVCDYPDYNVFNDRFGGRFGNRWDTVRNHFGSNGFNTFRQLRVNARCTTIVMPSSTTIVQDPATTTYAAPAPSGNDAASDPAPLPAIAPVKAPSTGGWDSASLLAHARVV